MKDSSLCICSRWRNWSPGALILFLTYVRSGRSTSASQRYWFAHLNASDPWSARYFPVVTSLCNMRFGYWMYSWHWRLIASWTVIVTVPPAAWGMWVFLSAGTWETTSGSAWGSLKPRQAMTEGSEPSGATKLVGAGAWDVRGEAESWGCAGEGKGGILLLSAAIEGRLWRRWRLLARGKGHKLPQGRFPTDSRKVSPHEGGQTLEQDPEEGGNFRPWSHSNLAGTLSWATCPQLALLRVGVQSRACQRPLAASFILSLNVYWGLRLISETDQS